MIALHIKAEIEAEIAKAYPEVDPGTELYADLVKLELRCWVPYLDSEGEPYGIDYYFARDDR